MLKLHLGDKGAPGYSGLAGEDGEKVSLNNYFMKYCIYRICYIFDHIKKYIITYNKICFININKKLNSYPILFIGLFVIKGGIGEPGRVGIPGVQGSEGEPGIYDPNLDEIRNGSEGPQGPIGKLYYLC